MKCIAPQIIAAVVTIGLTGSRAEACVCVGTYSGNPACQARWEYTEIFVGRVTSVVPAPTDAQGHSSGGATTRFVVTESFRGVQSRTYELVDSGSSCSYHFEAGKGYLVYASHGTVIICSPTKTVENAAEDLAYLRAIPATPPHDGRIAGIALHVEPSQQPGDRKPTPIADMRIVAEREGLRRSTTTGRDGKYEIPVPPGEYRVYAEPHAGMYSKGMFGETVELRDSRGCAVADFIVSVDGHVNARIVNADGTPVPYLTIELTPTTPSDAHAEAVGLTDEQGRIRLEHVPPGRFMLGFNTDRLFKPPDLPTVYLPGTTKGDDARIINVQPSEIVEAGNLVIPTSMQFVTLTGIVRDDTGKAVEGALVSLMTDGPNPRTEAYGISTSADGRFAIAALDGRRYVVTVDRRISRNESAHTEVHGIVAAPDMKPLVIVATRD